MPKFAIRIFIFLLFSVASYGQIPGLTQFTTDNGLSSNTIYDITQDEYGFIWFATDYGVSKFDGKNFKNFTIKDGLPGNEVLSLFKDSKNRIWMVAFNGKVGFLKNGQFFNEENTPFLKKICFSKFISDIYEDANGNIWFYQNLDNIIKLDMNLKTEHFSLGINQKYKLDKIFVEDINNQVHVFTHFNKNNEPSLITKAITKNSDTVEWEQFDSTLFSERTHDLISEKIGLVLRNNTASIKQIHSNLNKLKRHSQLKIYKIKNKFWLTNTAGGVYIFDNKDKLSAPNKILSNISTTKAFVDLESNIWIGSLSNGVYLFPNININGIQFDNIKRNDLHTITCFNNKLIVGNEFGEINIINKHNFKIDNTLKINNSPERVRHLKKRNDKLYILSDKNIHQLNTDFSLKRIRNMYDDSFLKVNLKNFKDISFSNKFIFTANSNGIAKINNETFETSKKWDKRSSALLAQKDSLWIGTTTGLYLFNDSIQKFDLNDQFNNSIIYAIEKVKNAILIGSNSYGLGILTNNTFKSFDTNDGLLSNYIKSITIDSNNAIWLATNFGLNCLILDKNNEIISIKSYTTSDGLYSNDVRDCYADISTNKVFVATSKGLNIIDLSDERTSILPPILHINEVLVNNISIDQNSDTNFEFDENNFQFIFSGISFKSLGNITFNYKLEGLEDEWISTKNNTVRYSSLPPNKYVFKLKAISKNNVESEEAVCFSFNIYPPFYETWWFKTILVVLIIGLLVFIKWLGKKKRRKEQLIKEQISALHYRALNAQMNPHFINNLMININSLANKGEFEHVNDNLDKFGELVNLVLRTTKSNLISLSEEIKMSSLYMDLEKSKFNKKIDYSINYTNLSEEDLDQILVPPMILQPIIENSIKHGFKNSKGNNIIEINLKTEGNDFLMCEIIDNGSGIDDQTKTKKTADSGISLENINKRLQLINESQSEENYVFISNLTDEFNNLVGSKITLKIPLISF